MEIVIFLRSDKLFYCPKDVFTCAVKRCLGKSSVPQSLQNPLAADGGIPRHFQIEPRFQTCDPIVHGAPIGHDKSVKAPFCPQNVCQKPLVLRAILAVDLIVRTHHRRRLCLFDNDLKNFEIDLPNGTQIGNTVTHKSVCLRIVERKVFHRCGNTVFLNAFHLCRRKRSRKQRILGKIFKIAPRKRISLNVRPWTQYDTDPVIARLFGDRTANSAQIFRVPSACRTCRRRECRSGSASRYAVIAPFRLHPESVRSV